MLKTDKRLNEFLKKIQPITGIKKLKLSDFRHPCHAREDHDIVKERILTINLVK